jgi:hypothetical protein
MASWSLLIALTGCRYDGVARTLSFSPAQPGPQSFFFSTGTGWGTARVDDGSLTLRLDHGTLDVAMISLGGAELGPARLAAGDTVSLER